MLMPLWGLFSRQPGWASFSSLWRSSKPVEQPALLFWITDACTISEMKSLATELHSLPYFTHLAYSECVLWKFTTSCASVGFWGLYNRIVINCFVVLRWGHCIFRLTGSVLFFSHWFPWVIPGSMMHRQGWGGEERTEINIFFVNTDWKQGHIIILNFSCLFFPF